MRKCLVLFAVCIYSISSDAQNVGVGVANPQNKLHVGGGFRLDTLTGVGGAGLLWHNPNGVVYGIKFSGNTNEVLRGDGTFGPYNPSINGALGWLLVGNSGTNPETNFIGTTDNQPLQFRLDNTKAGELNHITNNYGIGIGSLQVNTTGTQNVGFGRWAFLSNTTGSNNTSIGHDALSRNTTGSGNTAVGAWAMLLNTTGTRNTVVGNDALSRNTLGSDNTAIGHNALLQNLGRLITFPLPFITGNYNTAVGSGALYGNTDGSLNTAAGYNALGLNQNGGSNSAYGAEALKNNQQSGNSAFGSSALRANITGVDNVAVGAEALENNTTGYDNTAIGTQSLSLNNGYFNSALGSRSLISNSSGHDNTASGYSAMHQNSAGSFNTSIGAFSMYSNITGEDNTAVGYKAMELNGQGFKNTAVGISAMQNNTVGYSNSAFGSRALIANMGGLGNTAIGANALQNNTGGFWNTSIGFNSGNVPSNAGNITTIGYGTGWNTTSSNQVNIGNFSVTWIGGQTGWFHYSDKRIKNDIKDDVPGLSFVTRLKPISYHVDVRKQEEIANAGAQKNGELIKPLDKDWHGKYDVEKIKMTGFFAQDVEDAAKSINYSFNGVHNPKNGGLLSLDYSAFVVPLVKAVQEQQTIIEKQQKQIDDLLKRLELLEKK